MSDIYPAEDLLLANNNMGSHLRETLLAEKRRKPGGTTAVSCSGANPGMVSWFVKQAVVNLAKDLGIEHTEPARNDRDG
ncbi:hypothetical protein KC221_27740, partial [Mycobacterium tuberculosis]|nr:hypothetical protein [Mycobacterium tuberculosis]